MSSTLDLPDDLPSYSASPHEREPRALVALALEDFQLGQMTGAELQEVLGLAKRGALSSFLICHGAVGRYSADDLNRDRVDARRPGL